MQQGQWVTPSTFISIRPNTRECEGEKCCEDGPNYFGFIADGISLLHSLVPVTYCGNCVDCGHSGNDE